MVTSHNRGTEPATMWGMPREAPALHQKPVPLARIRPGQNVRIGDLPNIDSLARSIQLVGLLQPITVVPTVDDPQMFEVVFGHRRFAACRKVGLDPVPTMVGLRGTDRQRLLMQVAENVERDPMTPLEQARTFADLHRAGLTLGEIGEAVGLSGSRISTVMKLLEYPEIVQAAVHRRDIGLNDALAVPADLARKTDGRTLAAQCRRGGRHLRNWARGQLNRGHHNGRRAASSRDRSVVNVDGALLADCEDAAREMHEGIGEWVEQAMRARLRDHRSRRAGDAA